MDKKFLFSFFMLWGLCFGVCADMVLASGGKTAYQIIYTLKEKEAAEELAFHLKEITGADFKLVPEARAPKSTRTAF